MIACRGRKWYSSFTPARSEHKRDVSFSRAPTAFFDSCFASGSNLSMTMCCAASYMYHLFHRLSTFSIDLIVMEDSIARGVLVYQLFRGYQHQRHVFRMGQYRFLTVTHEQSQRESKTTMSKLDRTYGMSFDSVHSGSSSGDIFDFPPPNLESIACYKSLPWS